jgi:DNA-3-methyladenine glycosylase II
MKGARAHTNGKAATSALKASDRRLARLIDTVAPIDPQAWRKGRPVDNAFSVLVYSIIGQQISGYAADAIAGRFRSLFGGRMPEPAELLATDVAALKGVGLSGAKTAYIRSLAEHVVSGELDIDHIDELPDDEVRRQITAVKGLGPWTADMFLLIHLHRPDVLSGGDLGIRQAVQRLYKLDHLPSVKEVDEIGQKWRPHRSLAGFYLWASNRRVPTVPAPAKSRVK